MRDLKIAGVLGFLRENFPNDGAEGESVHALANAYEQAERERDRMAAELGAICVAATVRPEEVWCAVYGAATVAVHDLLAQRNTAIRERDEARARLAEAVLAQQAECSRLQAEVTQLRAERDMPCAHRLEEERLQERVRVLEGALVSISAYLPPGSGSVALQVCADMRDDARAALEGIEVE